MSDDQLDRLLELADGPMEFPVERRAELRRAMLETADADRAEPSDEAVRLRPTETGTRFERRRGWLVAATAACIVAVVGALVVVQRAGDPPAPVEPVPTDAPLTFDERCAAVRRLAEANGLFGVSGSPNDGDQLDVIAAHLDVLAADVADEEVADLATRVRLLARAVAEGQGGAVVNTRSAIGDDVTQLFQPGGACDR